MRNVERRRHVINYCVQKFLYTLVFVAGAANNGDVLHGNSKLSKRSLYLFFGKVFAFGLEISLHQSVVALGYSLKNLGSIFFSHIYEICRDIRLFHGGTEVVGIDVRFHGDEVYHTYERVSLTYGQLNSQGIGPETSLHHVDYIKEVCALEVHLINVCNTGNAILICLTPYRFGLGLNAASCAKYRYGSVQYLKRTFYFYSEVNVARGIYNVDSLTFPLGGGSSRSNGYTTLLLLRHPVHGCGAFMYFADLMNLTCVKKNTFGSSGLTCVDMSHYTDVSGVFQTKLSVTHLLIPLCYQR